MSGRIEQIGDATLYLGDCFEILPALEPVAAMVFDPSYEEILHAAKNSARGPRRTDGGPALKGLDFASVEAIRAAIVAEGARLCDGWFIAFCTIEGVAKWADEINPSPMRYKRACTWVKPDSTPQLNGQGPASGTEHFVTAWAGDGYARWNAGGKRGVYTHNTNSPDRHGVHPTEKPVALMAELVADFTPAAGVVADPFMGSGTTGVACARLGRPFIGIEINQAYFDIACERIDQAYRQGDLFVDRPPKVAQVGLFPRATGRAA